MFNCKHFHSLRPRHVRNVLLMNLKAQLTRGEENLLLLDDTFLFSRVALEGFGYVEGLVSSGKSF